MAVRTELYRANLPKLCSMIGSRSHDVLGAASSWAESNFDLPPSVRETLEGLLHLLVLSGHSYEAVPVHEHPILDLAVVSLVRGARLSELVLAGWKTSAFAEIEAYLGEIEPNGDASRCWGHLVHGRRLNGSVPHGPGLTYYGYLLNRELADLAARLDDIAPLKQGYLNKEAQLFVAEVTQAIHVVLEAGQDLFSITD